MRNLGFLVTEILKFLEIHVGRYTKRKSPHNLPCSNTVQGVSDNFHLKPGLKQNSPWFLDVCYN